jgi:hypothetical protein
VPGSGSARTPQRRLQDDAQSGPRQAPADRAAAGAALAARLLIADSGDMGNRFAGQLNGVVGFRRRPASSRTGRRRCLPNSSGVGTDGAKSPTG